MAHALFCRYTALANATLTPFLSLQKSGRGAFRIQDAKAAGIAEKSCDDHDQRCRLPRSKEQLPANANQTEIKK